MTALSTLRLWLKTALALFIPNSDWKGWRHRDIASAETYFEGINQASNEILWHNVDFSVLNRILEIGSNSGTRIFTKAKEYPKIEFIGIDINEAAVNKGNEEARKQLVQNLRFIQMDIRSSEFRRFIESSKFELIISWACLMYIHPIYLKSLLSLLLKHTDKLRLIEQYCSKYPFAIVRGGTQWKHNYAIHFLKLQRHVFPLLKLEITAVEAKIWNPGGGDAARVDIEIKRP